MVLPAIACGISALLGGALMAELVSVYGEAGVGWACSWTRIILVSCMFYVIFHWEEKKV